MEYAWCKQEEVYYPTTYPYNNCYLLCHIYPTNTLHTQPPPPSLCYIYPLPLFPTAIPPFASRPLSKIHPTILQLPQFCTHSTAPSNLSQIPHSTPRNEPHPPLHIIYLSSLTILHLLSSNNPAEPVPCLNSNLTLSTNLAYWSPCTNFCKLMPFQSAFRISFQSFSFHA